MARKTVPEPARNTPVMAEADVVVVGGGTTGVVAALAAAKNGAKTVLVEQSGHLGGTLLGGGLVIQGFFNHYVRFPEAERKQLIQGIPQEIVERMVEAGGCWGHVEAEIGGEYEPSRVVFDPEVWKMVSFKMMKDYGVHLVMRSTFVGALCEDNCLSGILVENKSGRWAILGKEFVDTTGDGAVAVRAGADYIDEENQDRPYKCGLIFGLGDVDLRKTVEFGMRHGIIRNLARARKGTSEETIVVLSLNLRELPSTAEVMKTTGMWGPFFGTTKQNEIHYVNTTAVEPESIINAGEALAAELALRDQISLMTNLLRDNVAGFESAYLKSTAPLLGVRRSRVVCCEYDITLDDIVQARGFPDEVGRFGWTDIPKYQPANGGSYGIPYRALIPKKIDHLLVAGRMITSQYEAHQSTRIVGCCWVQGEGAGTAAALAVRHGICSRELDGSLLQQTLLENGVVLERQA